MEELFFASSVTILVSYFLVVLTHSFFHTGDRVVKWASTFAMCSTGITFPIFFVTFCTFEKLSVTVLGAVMGLALALVLLELLRIVLDRYEIRIRRIPPPATLKSNAANFAGNVTLYLGMYTATLYSERPLFAAAGYMMCGLNLFRVLKYRLYDDFCVRKLGVYGSWLVGVAPKVAPPPHHVTLIQGLYNVFLRTYFFVSTTYAFIYLILFSNNVANAEIPFKYENESSILFVDFLYYSVFQLSLGGYGDISPKSAAAKLLSISEMLFGYLVLGSILALILGYTRRSRK